MVGAAQGVHFSPEAGIGCKSGPGPVRERPGEPLPAAKALARMAGSRRTGRARKLAATEREVEAQGERCAYTGEHVPQCCVRC